MAKGGAQAAAQQGKQRVWKKEEVTALAAQEGKYVYTFKGGVYDVNVDEIMHPGGRQLLEEYKGRDISDAFQGKDGSMDHAHSRGARALLENYCVGRLEGAAAEDRRDLSTLVDESLPLLPQVVKLDPADYMAWVDQPSTGHPTMFPSSFVERLTCTEWYVVPLLWLPVAAAYMWRGVQGGGLSPAMLPVTTLLGVLIWQLMEYSIHKGLFHFDPKTPKGIEWHFMLHGHHHKYPMDFDRLVFPPPIAALVIGLFHLLLHALLPLSWASPLLGGGVAGYVLYDTTHWALHSGRADWMFTRTLKSSHMEHHYMDDTVGYGISSTLYDRLFGTLSQHLAKKAL